MKQRLLCILGETASGKDTIVNKALEKLDKYNIRKVCSYTDRPIRKNETEGIEHYFVNKEEFDHLRKTRSKDIIAYTLIKDNKQKNYNGYQYMAFNDELEKSHIYIIDYNGLKYLKELYSDIIDIVTIYIHAPLSTRLERASTRSDFNTEFKNRVEAEEKQFKEFKNLKLYDYKINNIDGKLERSINQMCKIIEYELFNNYIDNSPLFTPLKNK